METYEWSTVQIIHNRQMLCTENALWLKNIEVCLNKSGAGLQMRSVQIY